MKALIALIALAALSSARADVYGGEPFGEALFDVVRGGGVPVSHELVRATPKTRTDVFRLKNGSLLAITSDAGKLGDPFTVKKLSVGTAENLKAVESVNLPAAKSK